MNFPKPKYKKGDTVTVNGINLTISQALAWPDKVVYYVNESLVHLYENEDGSLYTDKPQFLKGFDGMVVM